MTAGRKADHPHSRVNSSLHAHQAVFNDDARLRRYLHLPRSVKEEVWRRLSAWNLRGAKKYEGENTGKAQRE
jgi:hypothetical protein